MKPCGKISGGNARFFLGSVVACLLALSPGVILGGSGNSASDMPMPQNFQARERQLRVDLSWELVNSPAEIQIQRSRSVDGPFEALPSPLPTVNAYSDFLGSSGGEYFYRIRAVPTNNAGGSSNASSWSAACSASPKPLDAEALPAEVEEAAFRYFYDYGHPVSGLARVGTGKGPDTCSIGGTGWTLCNLVVGAERGFVTREQAAQRARRILQFLSVSADRFHGAFPHWINGATGKTIPFSQMDDGADLVETSFLMEGVLLSREYFTRTNSDEAQLRQLADALWREVEWTWFTGQKEGRPCLMWHWSPNFGWSKNHGISGFNECHIVYVLALASPVHPVSPQYYYQGWLSPNYGTNRQAFGIPLKLGKGLGPPLFWTEFSYLGLDPRQLTYEGQTYFDCFRDFCRVQVLYAKSRSGEFKGYDSLWGLSASRGPHGYHAFEPGPRDNGTIAPSAALASMPYVPVESRAFLVELYQHYGEKYWGPFGFYDAFNWNENWCSHDYLGNEVGPIAPMIENYRSDLCWKTFMKAPEIRRVLGLLEHAPQGTVGKSAP